MRPVAQIALAAAVVAGSAAAALAITNSALLFEGSRIMNVTHTWSIQGEGKGKTQFGIEFGGCAFGTDRATASFGIVRTRPVGMPTYGYVTAYVPRKSATETVYRAGVNSGARGLSSDERLQILADQGFIVGPLVAAEDPTETGKYHPIRTNVSLTWAATSLNARVYQGFTRYNLDMTTNYRGTIDRGMDGTRNVKGAVRVRGRNLPRGSL